MKLYTEEQLHNTVVAVSNYLDDINLGRAQEKIEKHLKALQPIVLPSDEEIIYRCFQEDSYELATDGDSALKTYTDGYRAALEQILNQNK